MRCKFLQFRTIFKYTELVNVKLQFLIRDNGTLVLGDSFFLKYMSLTEISVPSLSSETVYISEAELCGYYGLHRVLGALSLCSLSGQFVTVDFILFGIISFIFRVRLLYGVSFSSSYYVRVNCRWIGIPCLQIIGHYSGHPWGQR